MKRISTTLHLVLALSLALLIGACTSPQKLALQGNYDEAIRLSVKKLQRNKQKDKHILTLENAFNKAQKRDLGRIEFLRKEGQPDSWEEINFIAKKIASRQKLVDLVRPLSIKSEGRNASLNYVQNLDDLYIESKEKAAEYLYVLGQQLIDQSKKENNKMAARQAYYELDKISEYYRTYRDRETLMREAQQLGINNVYFKLKNSSMAVLPAGFERELLRMSVSDLNREWVRYYLTRPEGRHFDYEIIAHLNFVEVGPEMVREREYSDEKEVEDGFEYVLDERGNVAKDSLGNDIKVTKYKIIRATVFETHQEKIATVRGDVEYYDNATGEIMQRIPLTATAVFENYAATFRGDKNALSDQSRRRIGNRPRPFPTDPELLLTAAERLKDVVKGLMVNNRRLVEREN